MKKNIQEQINAATLELCRIVAAANKKNVPQDIMVARRIARGGHKNKGVTINMGLSQLCRLAEEYLPGSLKVSIQLEKK